MGACEVVDTRSLGKKTRSLIAIQKIGSQFPPTPEGRLLAAVLTHTVRDLASPSAPKIEKKAARFCLLGKIWFCEVAGVDSDWVREVLIREGVVEDGYFE